MSQSSSGGRRGGLDIEGGGGWVDMGTRDAVFVLISESWVHWGRSGDYGVEWGVRWGGGGGVPWAREATAIHGMCLGMYILGYTTRHSGVQSALE